MSDLHPAFKEVQDDPDVCNNCFRRTHDRYERNYRIEVEQVEDEDGKLHWEPVPVDVSAVEVELPSGETKLVGGFDDKLYRKLDDTDRIPSDRKHGLITICDCGFRWGPKEVIEEWKNRPLDKRTFFEYADRLKSRFRENGVDFDEEAFDDILDDLKSDPDEQFADERIFSKAIDHASKISSVRSSTGRSPKGERT